MKYERFELDNGLRVILVPMESVESATVLILGNTGSRFESKDQWGIAHFFEHMVFKGTKSYPSPLDVALAFDSIGALSNAFTSKEYTGYFAKTASKHIPLALKVLSEMMFFPLLKEADIKRESGVIIEEINMYLDQPMQQVGNEFEKLMYAGSGLAHDILGTKKSVASFTPDDFKKFLAQWYGPANLTLVIAGDASSLTQPDLNKQIEKNFNLRIKNRESKRQPTHQLAIKEKRFGSSLLKVVEKETEQAHLVLAWPGIRLADKRRPALSLLSVVMGGNMSSRLFVEVREKRGLGYYVRSENDYYHHAGAFGAAAGVDPARVHQAIEVIVDQFRQLAEGKRPITGKELENAKEYLAGQVSLSLEDSRSVAQWFGLKDVLLNEIKTPAQSLAKVQAVSLDEVNKLAKELVQSGQMRLAVIGPFRESEFRKYVGVDKST